MSTFPEISPVHIEPIARTIADCGTGTDINTIIAICNMEDGSGESTKWRRLNYIFLDYRNRNKNTNHIFLYIKTLLAPSRFVNDEPQFETHRQNINMILSFSGVEYGSDGEFRKKESVRTISEAEKRYNILRTKLQGRTIHSEALKYCKTELLQDNYFHAVFEASKGLAQRIRNLSGIEKDGAALVDQVFSIEKPILIFNSLTTETEKSEHKGFACLLKGCFMSMRNPLAHEPKIMWTGEEDAADYLTFISMLHRQLDKCSRTCFSPN